MAEGDKSTNTTTTSNTNPQIDAVWQRIGERAKTASNIKAAKNKTKKKAVITTSIILVTILLAVAGFFIWRHLAIASEADKIISLVDKAESDMAVVVNDVGNFTATGLGKINCRGNIENIDQSKASIEELLSTVDANIAFKIGGISSDISQLRDLYNNYLIVAEDFKNFCYGINDVKDDITFTDSIGGIGNIANLSSEDRQRYANSITSVSRRFSDIEIKDDELKQAIDNYIESNSAIMEVYNSLPEDNDEASRLALSKYSGYMAGLYNIDVRLGQLVNGVDSSSNKLIEDFNGKRNGNE